MPRQDVPPVRIGLNYTPSRHWYYCWNDWDAGSIAHDLDAIASVHADHIRVQLIWPYFQPNPTYVSQAHLDRLGELMDMADRRGLGVLVALLTGYLSGYAFLPPKVDREDVFTREDVLESELLLGRRVLETVGSRDNFIGLDVGNEINCLAPYMKPAIGDAWADRLADGLRPHLGDGWWVNGIDHMPVIGGTTFSMEHLGQAYHAFCLHCWPMFSGCLEKGPVDGPASTLLAAFCTQLARLFCDPTDKPIWIQEFGCCDLWAPPEVQQAYLRASMTSAVAAGARWLTWWCSHDKTRDIRFTEWEYHYGLFTPDNQPKPLAGVFRETVDRLKSAPPQQPPASAILAVPADFTPGYTRQLPPRQWVQQGLASTTWELFDAWLAHCQDGATPRLAWKSDADGLAGSLGVGVVQPEISETIDFQKLV